jgi:hypothetical protein
MGESFPSSSSNLKGKDPSGLITVKFCIEAPFLAVKCFIAVVC